MIAFKLEFHNFGSIDDIHLCIGDKYPFPIG